MEREATESTEILLNTSSKTTPRPERLLRKLSRRSLRGLKRSTLHISNNALGLLFKALISEMAVQTNQ